jgi:hypothetical protein
MNNGVGMQEAIKGENAMRVCGDVDTIVVANEATE